MSGQKPYSIHALELGPMANFVYLVQDHESGRAALVDPAWDVAEVVAGPRVLEKRPLEVWIPPSRGAMAKFSDLVPQVGFRLAGLLRKRGRAKQKRMQAERGG